MADDTAEFTREIFYLNCLEQCRPKSCYADGFASIYNFADMFLCMDALTTSK